MSDPRRIATEALERAEAVRGHQACSAQPSDDADTFTVVGSYPVDYGVAGTAYEDCGWIWGLTEGEAIFIANAVSDVPTLAKIVLEQADVANEQWDSLWKSFCKLEHIVNERNATIAELEAALDVLA